MCIVLVGRTVTEPGMDMERGRWMVGIGWFGWVVNTKKPGQMLSDRA